MISSLLLRIAAAACKSVRNDCVTHVYLEGAESSWSGEAVKASHIVARVPEANGGGNGTAYSFAKDFRRCLGTENRAYGRPSCEVEEGHVQERGTVV